MSDFYPYLIPSLPMLQFGMKPPFSYEQLLAMCHHRIPEPDYALLLSLPQAPEYSANGTGQKTIRKWIDFDTALRNELVKIRAQKIHRDPAASLQGGVFGDPSVTTSVTFAMGNPSLLEAELALDKERWNALEQCATGHYFDVDLLITYAYKLLILTRWENVRNADAARMLEQILEAPR